MTGRLAELARRFQDIINHITDKPFTWGQGDGTLADQTDLQTALDGKADVESGSFDIEIGGSSDDGDITYGIRTSVYQKIGDLCHVYAIASIDTINTAPTGNIQIYGFPFTISGDLSIQWFPVSRVQNINNTAGVNQLSLQSRTGTRMELRGVNYEGSQSTIPTSNLTNNTSIIINFVYRTT